MEEPSINKAVAVAVVAIHKTSHGHRDFEGLKMGLLVIAKNEPNPAVRSRALCQIRMSLMTAINLAESQNDSALANEFQGYLNRVNLLIAESDRLADAAEAARELPLAERTVNAARQSISATTLDMPDIKGIEAAISLVNTEEPDCSRRLWALCEIRTMLTAAADFADLMLNSILACQFRNILPDLNRFIDQSQRKLAGTLDSRQANLLKVVKAKGPITTEDLAKELSCSPTAVDQIASSLNARVYIESISSLTSSSKTWLMTKTGQDALWAFIAVNA